MGNKSKRILDIQERAQNDETYQNLMEEHTQRNALFLDVMAKLDEEQRSAIYDYFGVVIEMQYNMIILALESSSDDAAGVSKGGAICS